MAGNDEDAFRWGGDDDNPLVSPAPRRRAKKASQPGIEPTVESDTLSDADEDHDEDSRPSSSSGLVAMGVLGGVYFLYTLGWLTYTLRSLASLSDPVAGFMWNLGSWLAVLAPALWFGLSFRFVQRPGVRYAALVIGALVLIPIPLVWPR